MRELDGPIGRVWRRLRFQRFLSALVWCWAGTLALAALVLAAEKLANRPLPGEAWWPLAIAGALGLVAAVMVALVRGPSRIDAAVAIDRAFHLNERLSTALTLPEALSQSDAGRALIADAVRHMSVLEVGSAFGPRLPRLAWLPLIPGALAVAMLFVPDFTHGRAQARPTEAVEKRVVAQQTKALGKKVASQRKELDKTKFAEADKLLADIEKAAESLAKAPPARKDQALVQLNKLTDAVKERQKQLGSPEQMNRQLQQLKEMASAGPASDFAKDLAKGDFQKAAEELKKLRDKLQAGKLSEADKKALKEQLGDMTKALQKLANLDQRKKQLDEARKNGGLSQEQFQKEMAKLNDQAKGLESLQKLAAKLGQAQSDMSKGDSKKAAESLGMGEKQLAEMAKQLQEIEALDGALADLQDAKNGMTGDGTNQLGETLGGLGLNSNGRGQNNGMGRGRGEGDRPEAPDATASYNTKVKPQIGKGKAVMEGFAPPSASMKGQSVIDIQGDVEAGAGLSAEALTNQKIPRNIEKHVRGYFDQINKGR